MTETVTSHSYKHKDRHYKKGDVIRWCPSWGAQELVEKQGLGVVVEANGPLFKAYWTGDGQVRSHDARPLGSMYLLQDYAPIPQVAEWWKNQSK
jgi:hypothetical protein